ncbi:hypothetical protein [Streptomyces sp. NBC_00439]|uniref:hypothetical protein n=1 Tax=Streptomyces sp. NBC_00439 TaxID=2903650 RepID=UPI002256A400|nr:hypothetical protein [Streptomyces sp. NBC_00439]MCX5103515.1 hypothetical protein [Streptomyces sp. NBC_00439]
MPYDTGARCEPNLWQSDADAAAKAMRSGQAEGIGVDFTNDENNTVVTVHVSHSNDGLYTVHLMPMRDDEKIRVELHCKKGLVVIESDAERPA